MRDKMAGLKRCSCTREDAVDGAEKGGKGKREIKNRERKKDFIMFTMWYGSCALRSLNRNHKMSVCVLFFFLFSWVWPQPGWIFLTLPAPNLHWREFKNFLPIFTALVSLSLSPFFVSSFLAHCLSLSFFPHSFPFLQFLSSAFFFFVCVAVSFATDDPDEADG